MGFGASWFSTNALGRVCVAAQTRPFFSGLGVLRAIVRIYAAELFADKVSKKRIVDGCDRCVFLCFCVLF